MSGTILITVHPERVSPAALALVDTVLATGSEAAEILSTFAQITHIGLPQAFLQSPQPGQALLWFVRNNLTGPTLITSRIAKAERRRHLRNYAEGALSPEQGSFSRSRE